MIHMIFVFIALTLVISLVFGAWSSAGKDERWFVLTTIGKSAIFASIAFAFLFVIINVF